MSEHTIAHTLYNGTTTQIEDDGYINITALTKAYFEKTGIRREPNGWLRSKKTQKLIQDFSTISGLEYSKLIKVVKGMPVDGQGTWVHSQLAISFKAWLLDNAPTGNSEKQVQQRLQHELGGFCEKITPAGAIDLLTDIELIEIKAVKDWKNAVGQVMVFSVFYPQHTKRIHLFGKAEVELRIVICEVCEKLQIKVSFEEGYINPLYLESEQNPDRVRSLKRENPPLQQRR